MGWVLSNSNQKVSGKDICSWKNYLFYKFSFREKTRPHNLLTIFAYTFTEKQSAGNSTSNFTWGRIMKFKPQTVNDCRPMGATCFKATNKAVVCMQQWGQFRFEIAFRLVCYAWNTVTWKQNKSHMKVWLCRNIKL